MKTLLKISAVIFGLIFLMVIGAVVFVATLNPNDYKDWIADRIRQETGRELAIAGDMDLTLYPWLGLEINGLTLGNAAGFGDDPFLHVDHAKFRVKLMPLLNRQYEIDTVRLYGAEINLARNKEGVSNWDDLAGEPEDEDTDWLQLTGVVLGGVDIRDAGLSWDDRSAGVRYEIRDLTVTTGELVYGEPVDIALSLNAIADKPELQGSVNLSGMVFYDLEKGKYDIEPLQLVTTIGGPNVPGGTADIKLASAIHADLAGDTLAISNLDFTALGTHLTGDVNVSRMQSPAPAVQSAVRLTGEDLAVLFKVAEIEPLASQIAGLAERSFDISAALDMDMQRGSLDISTLQADLLGATIRGDINALDIRTDTPIIKGRLNASGPDLPTLIQVLGRLQGRSGAGLSQIGERLHGVSGKSFAMDADFDADLKRGNIQIPVLSVNTLGVSLEGNLNARDMDRASGSVAGKVTLASDRISEVLAALGREDIAPLIQSVRLDAGIGGNRTDLNISPLDLKLTLAGKQIPDSPVDLILNADSRINLDRETLGLDSFRLAGLGVNVSGRINASGITDTPKFSGELNIAEFNLRRLLRQLNQDIPETADRKSLEKLSLASSFDGSGNHVNIDQMALVLDDSTMTGSFSVADFDRPAIRFSIDIDRIDADRYLPPQAQADRAPVTPETAAGAATQLPVDTLRTLDMNGELSIGQLIISRARLSDVALSLKAKDGMIDLSPVQAELYQGSYRGDIRLDATTDQPVVGIQTRLQGVQIEPLMLDFMEASGVSGTANIELQARAAGVDADTLKRTLNGNGRIVLEDGVLKGVDVGKLLAQIEVMLKSRRLVQVDRGGETPFDQFSSTIQITDGVVSSDDLVIVAPGWRVTGKGTIIDLKNEEINYSLVAAADPGSATLDTQRYDIGGYTIPIACRGKIADPSCLPDVSEIVKVAVRREVEKKVGDVLQRALGVEEDPAAAKDGEATDQQTETPDPGRDLIKKGLKSIFR